MKYTKEQAEMLALLMLAACAVLVLSFVHLVRPQLAAAAKSERELEKMETDIGKLSRASTDLAKAEKEKRSLTDTIESGQKAVFGGMEAGSPLSQICAQTGVAAGVKPAYGEQTSRELSEFSEKTADGTQKTKHYDEVARMLEMRSVDFFSLCDFLGAAEQANEGLRVSGLRIESTSLDSTLKSQGTVNANVELSLLGIREGEPPSPSTLVVNAPSSPDVAEKRNPFGPAQERPQTANDPLASAKELLKKIRVSGTIGEWLLLEVPTKTPSGQQGVERVNLRRGQTAIIGGLNMRYVGTLGDSLVFEVIAHEVRFILEADHKGEVTTVREEAMK